MYQENWFGLLSSVIGKKRSASVKATLDCKLYRLSVEDIKNELQKNEKVYAQFNNLINNIEDIYTKCIRNAWGTRNLLGSFHNEFLIELTIDILTKISLFEHQDTNFLFDLVSNMKPEVVPRGQIIISRDDEPDCLYCVLNGSVEVFSYANKEEEKGKNKNYKDSNNKENISINNSNVMIHAEMSSGSFFGEIGLLLGIKRTSSIRIKEKSLLVKLNKDILTTISEKYPKIQLGINKRTNGYMLAIQEKMVNQDDLEQFDLEVNCQNLRKIDLFNNFDNSTLEEIAMGMTRESYQPNDYIIKCGDNAESMFFLTHGSIEVLSENNKVVDIAKGPNVYFGEVALLEDVPRTASIRAITPCSVFVLTKKTLLSVVKKNSQFEAEIEKTSRERLQRHLMRSILA
ncbi:camp-binding domain-like protein [Piromyces finnis]|uniref:Camp-binding domain-like protein n=1 Tax=Piromyces finnis TaxID=1754191 RepID=A0A1Y1VC09_9FUNG|nr:camp-binding domain-like protein [Piromyces finnis]|eukprot:ORX52199.1 camp-binding domain-like protein [Piromyces finnis]